MSSASSTARSRERTLRVAWILSAWAPFTSGAAFWIGGTAVLLGDFLRRTSEFIGVFVSWLVVWRSSSEPGDRGDPSPRREGVASLVTAAAMIVSACAIAVRAVAQVLSPVEAGNLSLGMFVVSAGALVNMAFWRRFRRLADERSTPVVEAQWRLYRAKTATDCAVLAVLLMHKLYPQSHWPAYADSIVSVCISVLLAISGVTVVNRSIGALSGADTASPPNH